MGIVERKEREKREMRELIIRTAMDLFVERGFGKTSMRAIANEIDYSPATIYLYFKDKNEIFFAIHKKAFSKFLATFEALSHVENPMERLKALGRNYIKFAIEHPKYYDVMFIMQAPMEVDENQDSWDVGIQSHSFLEATVQACVEQRYLKGDVQKLSFLMWSMVHGMSSLLIRDRLKMYDCEIVENLMKESMELVYKALEVEKK